MRAFTTPEYQKEICVFFHQDRKEFRFNGKEGVHADFRKMKETDLVCLPQNQKEFTKNGKTYYYLGLSAPNGDSVGQAVIAMCMKWSDANAKFEYIFRTKKNRDAMAQWINKGRGAAE